MEGDSSKAVGPGKARQITGGREKQKVQYTYIYIYYIIHIPMFIHVDIIYLHIKIA